MAHPYVNRAFYEAIIRFDESDEAQEYYYKIMDTEMESTIFPGRSTIREQILRAYTMLFCEDLDMEPGAVAGPDEVEQTADRLYIDKAEFDPKHWYRMQHHFPIIDEDNYDRFAALVISDLNAGDLHDAVVNGGAMLLVGELDPLHMTSEQRKNQHIREVDIPQRGDE